MDTRREFFKRAAMLTGGVNLLSALLPSIEKAAAIAPAEESTYLDAEHVVILMQENRSFDHCFGTLRGVRGFNDPRAVTLPDQKPVWCQTNAAGETYPPFRLDAQQSNATWLGSLPHSWTDQNDAKNGGDHDRWLIAKPVKREDCAGMPLTMGYYTREDLPFYYALADAFTICDQHFCSSLTGTTPNRLYLWSGAIREEQNANSPANVRNENVDYGAPARWTTFPERLEDAGVSWKIYQNELSLASGLNEDQDAWLANFGDNPIEWFPQFAVQFAHSHRKHLSKLSANLPGEIQALETQLSDASSSVEKAKIGDEIKNKRSLLSKVIDEQKEMEGVSFNTLPARTQNLHAKAFTINAGDPDYRTLTALKYEDGTATRELQVPKGDILYQFREDVTHGNLPAVSWIVAPEKFSDHPTAPWYGAWYVAEVMNILTHNPAVWKKTIFILTYDENDGFFDHIPPFASPHPEKSETGVVSAGIDTAVEYVTLDQDLTREPPAKARGGSIGLGFRVPLLIASPWSRGGAVCSQVFDHTSVLQFLENFASRKSGKHVSEPNISEWRRTICGDLSSVFVSASERPAPPLSFPEKDAFIERIHNARFKQLPGYRALSAADIEEYRRNPHSVSWMPQQEQGIRPARALPYELHAQLQLTPDRQSLELTLSARNQRFGPRAAGSPFHVYAPAGYLHRAKPSRVRSYAVKAGQTLQDHWQLSGFEGGRYHLCVCGPNGFLLEAAGDAEDPLLVVDETFPKDATEAQIEILLTNTGDRTCAASITHHAYGYRSLRKEVPPGSTSSIVIPLKRSHGWYDFSIGIEGSRQFARHYAGHLETGIPSFSDPAMGRVSI